MDNALKTEDDVTNTLYDHLCATESKISVGKSSRKPIEHHVFDGEWVARPSKPHPIMTVKLTPLPDDHARLGYPLRSSNPSPIDIPMVADSGCQSCIIPLRSALAMGINRGDIAPVTLAMRGAIEEDLGVEGGVIVEISTVDDLKKVERFRTVRFRTTVERFKVSSN